MNAYIVGSLAVFLLFQIGAVFGLIYRRNDLADVLWGPGFLLTGLAAVGGKYLQGHQFQWGLTEILIFLFVGIWSTRLAIYVGTRYYKKGKEDVRYNNWRKAWGDTWLWRSYLQVFVLQPIILIVMALPIMRAVEVAPQTFSLITAIGTAVWIFGFLFECIADDQLRRFTKDPKNKGRIMDRGLWSWSRHPNYFGEVVLWWGIFLMASNLEDLWLVVAPIAVTILILKVSGVDMLEALMEKRPGFAEYKKRTSVFIPLPPRK